MIEVSLELCMIGKKFYGFVYILLLDIQVNLDF